MLPGGNALITADASQKPESLAEENRQKVQVDYNDIPSLARTLEEHAVHTVISAISIYDGETSQSQLNLIQAADKSNVTSRFIPSEYSFIQTKE